MSNLSINLRAIADASVRRVYNNARPSHSAPSALPLFRAAASQLHRDSPAAVEAGSGSPGSMGLVEVPAQGSGLAFVPPPPRQPAAAAGASGGSTTGAGTGAGAGAGASAPASGGSAGSSPAGRARGTRLRRPTVPVRHPHRGVKRPLPPRFATPPLPGSSAGSDVYPVGSFPGAGPSERVARARIGSLDSRRHTAHASSSHVDVGRLRQLSVSGTVAHVRARSLTADSMTPPKFAASASASGVSVSAAAAAGTGAAGPRPTAAGATTPGGGTSAGARASARNGDGFRTRRRRAMSLSYGGARSSSSAGAMSASGQGVGAAVSPPAYGFRTRPRSGSSGGDDAGGEGSASVLHSPVGVGTPSPRTSTATLLRKAVLLYTRAVAANAKKEGTAPPTAESVRKLISITTTPNVGMQLLRRAENLYRRLFGDTHPSVAAVHKVMGCILVHSGDRKARSMAMGYFNKAAAVCAVTFGPKHAVTMDVEYNIALLHSQNGKHAAAAMGFARVLASYETAHGAEATPTRFIRAQLRHSRQQYRQQRYTQLFSRGLAALQEGQAGVALRAFTEALQLPLKQRDQQCAYSICVCHCRLGDVGASLEWFRRAVEWGFHDAALLVNDDDIEPLRRLPEFWELAGQRFGLERPEGIELAAPGSVASARTLLTGNLAGDTIMEGDEEDDEEGEGDAEGEGSADPAAGKGDVGSYADAQDGSCATPVRSASLALQSGLLGMSASSAALVSPLHVPNKSATAAPLGFSASSAPSEGAESGTSHAVPASAHQVASVDIASASASCGAGRMDVDADDDGECSVRKEEHGSTGSVEE